MCVWKKHLLFELVLLHGAKQIALDLRQCRTTGRRCAHGGRRSDGRSHAAELRQQRGIQHSGAHCGGGGWGGSSGRIRPQNWRARAKTRSHTQTIIVSTHTTCAGGLVYARTQNQNILYFCRERRVCVRCFFVCVWYAVLCRCCCCFHLASCFAPRAVAIVRE